MTEEDKRAEQIIFSYLEFIGLSIKPGTEEYAAFMKNILLDRLFAQNRNFPADDFKITPVTSLLLVGYAQ